MVKHTGYTLFEYLYRDASNYKAWGQLLLSGQIRPADIAALRSTLDSGEYFVAEQVGVPGLYKALWKLTNGATGDDHCFHEFVELRAATDHEIAQHPVWGSVAKFIRTFKSVKSWNCTLSPNSQYLVW
ncbi:hypothetical protein [Sulfuricella sp.]|uniref:hypothetical protein n=1 Tax=Sulfuricella sp. TaxID=2099377 RepID=UPI002C3A1C78|nr:hypothetical protein [Sulfuricella sp.]HUX64909.1 hypothetical protein [Sulfuricella sp.]